LCIIVFTSESCLQLVIVKRPITVKSVTNVFIIFNFIDYCFILCFNLDFTPIQKLKHFYVIPFYIILSISYTIYVKWFLLDCCTLFYSSSTFPLQFFKGRMWINYFPLAINFFKYWSSHSYTFDSTCFCFFVSLHKLKSNR